MLNINNDIISEYNVYCNKTIIATFYIASDAQQYVDTLLQRNAKRGIKENYIITKN